MNSKVIIALLWLGLLGSAVAQPPSAPLPTLALIPGEGQRAPAELLAAQMEAALSTNRAFALVERAQVRRVLAEQSLTANGFVRAEQAVKVGQLLAADLFVFIERAPGATNQLWQIQIIEARSGIALGHLAESGETLARDPETLVASLSVALEKWRVPPVDRHYVGVLGFRSEEIGRSLDTLATMLDSWLPLDLSSSSNVVILDRRHLDYLTQEQNLTGVDVQIKGSAMLVKGTVRRISDSPQVTAKFSLQSFGGTAAETFTVNVATNDFAGLRSALAQSVAAKLNVHAPVIGSFDPKREAALFARRAEELLQDNQFDAAICAAEAAVAIQPTVAYRVLAATLWESANAQIPARMGTNLLFIPNPESRRRIFAYSIRAAELQRESLELILDELRRTGMTTNTFFGGAPGGWRAFYFEIAPNESEALQQRDELRKQLIALFPLERDYYAAYWNQPVEPGRLLAGHPQSRWNALMMSYAKNLGFLTDNADEWGALLRELIASYQNRPARYSVLNAYGAPPFLAEFWSSLDAQLTPVNKFSGPAQRQIIDETADSLVREGDPALRLIGTIARANLSGGMVAVPGLIRPVLQTSPEEARGALDYFLREFPYDHPLRKQGGDYQFPAGVISTMVVRSLKQPDLATYASAILEPILQARDGARLCAWDALVIPWLDALKGSGQADEARLRAQECLDLLPSNAPDGRNLADLRQNLRRHLNQAPPPGPQSTGDWSVWNLTCLSTNALPNSRVPGAWGITDARPQSRMVAALMQKDRLLTVWNDILRTNREQTTLWFCSQPLTGGQHEVLAEVAFKHQEPGQQLPIAVATVGDTIWVGTPQGGLIEFNNGRTKLLTEENGLPANGITALACLDGKVYLGLGQFRSQVASGFAVLDPATGSVTELASSRSTANRNVFDGESSFRVESLLADPERHCLWMAVSSAVGPPAPIRFRTTGPLNGCWKFTPATGKFEKVYSPPMLASGPLSWGGGKVVVGVVSGELCTLDPNSREVAWLLAGIVVTPSEPPTFGMATPGGGNWLWLGDELFTGGSTLNIRTRGKPGAAAMARNPQGLFWNGIVSFFEREPGRVLFVTMLGELWQLQRTAAPVKSPPGDEAGEAAR